MEKAALVTLAFAAALAGCQKPQESEDQKFRREALTVIDFGNDLSPYYDCYDYTIRPARAAMVLYSPKYKVARVVIEQSVPDSPAEILQESWVKTTDPVMFKDRAKSYCLTGRVGPVTPAEATDSAGAVRLILTP